MRAILTGDIINSRRGEVEKWLASLKEVLHYYGKDPKDWEIYRGDSFQLSLVPEAALMAAFHIKSALKKTGDYDVRIGIGIGEVIHDSDKITEANGSAYIRSGECFESLKKQTLAIKSSNEEVDKLLNIMFSLSLLTVNNWSSTVAEVIKVKIEHLERNQTAIAEMLNKSQSSISEALKRGGFDEILMMNEFYKTQINKLC